MGHADLITLLGALTTLRRAFLCAVTHGRPASDNGQSNRLLNRHDVRRSYFEAFAREERAEVDPGGRPRRFGAGLGDT